MKLAVTLLLVVTTAAIYAVSSVNGELKTYITYFTVATIFSYGVKSCDFRSTSANYTSVVHLLLMGCGLHNMHARPSSQYHSVILVISLYSIGIARKPCCTWP